MKNFLVSFLVIPFLLISCGKAEESKTPEVLSGIHSQTAATGGLTDSGS